MQRLNFLLYTTEVCYVMTTFRCQSDILIMSWLFTARWSTWPGSHLVPWTNSATHRSNSDQDVRQTSKRCH